MEELIDRIELINKIRELKLFEESIGIFRNEVSIEDIFRIIKKMKNYNPPK